jgi:hypothetical protein
MEGAELVMGLKAIINLRMVETEGGWEVSGGYIPKGHSRVSGVYWLGWV